MSETFLIDLPDGAFNPSLIRHHGNLVCAYRCSNHRLQTHIQTVQLGEVPILKPAHEPHAIHPLPGPHLPSIWEDPRLFHFHDRLFCSFTAWGPIRGGHQTGVGVAELNRNTLRVMSSRYPRYGHNTALFAGTPRGGQEKNWVFFEFGGRMHFIYGAEPLEIVEYDYDRDSIVNSTCSYRDPNWTFGAIRGGTPPVLSGNRFYTFFHSWALTDDPIASPSADGEQPKHLVYHMGVITFRPERPFRLEEISRVPLLSGWRETGCEKSVVFPGGAVPIDDGWLVACGENDRRCVVHKFTHAEIAASLRPFDQAEPRTNLTVLDLYPRKHAGYSCS